MATLDNIDISPKSLVIREVFKKLIDKLKDTYPILAQSLEKLINSSYYENLNPSGLAAIIQIIQDNIDEPERLNWAYNLLFNPQVTPKEVVKSKFKVWHQEIFKEPSGEFATLLEETPGAVLLLKSGMYGGKSTLANMICEKLEKKGFQSFVIVPSDMTKYMDGESPKVTVRGEDDENGDNLELDALPANLDIANQIVAACPDGKGVVHFDEYSFMDAAEARAIIEKLTRAGIRVILAGLDTNFLAVPLAGYEMAEGIKTFEYTCRSFVYGQADNGDDTTIPEPEGRMTMRYMHIGDGQWVLDLGFARVIIPKENLEVLYAPGRVSDHPTNILAGTKYINGILHPDEVVQQMQGLVTHTLDVAHRINSSNRAALLES